MHLDDSIHIDSVDEKASNRTPLLFKLNEKTQEEDQKILNTPETENRARGNFHNKHLSLSFSSFPPLWCVFQLFFKPPIPCSRYQ